MKMLKDEGFDVEKLIRKQEPVAFGIDLHWMAHVQGALAIAEIIKRTPPIFRSSWGTFCYLFPQGDYLEHKSRSNKLKEGGKMKDGIWRTHEVGGRKFKGQGYF